MHPSRSRRRQRRYTRWPGQLGLDTEAGQEVDLTQFEDADEISEDAADAVRWAYAADLLTEKDGKLHVADELTRKELTRMLEDFLDLI